MTQPLFFCLSSKSFFKHICAFFFLALPLVAYASCLGARNVNVAAKSVLIVPQFPPAVLYARWAPFLESIGKSTNQCFDLIVPASIPAFEDALLAGKPDFAFMNPFHQVLSRDSYIPLVANGEGGLDGLLVVKEGGDITSINQLAGKKVAFPAPNAFGATLLIRAYLAKQGVIIEPVYVKTHSNVYRSVIVGDVAAGGVINLTYEAEPKEIRERIKILYKSPKFSPHPFSANSTISPDIRAAITQAIINLNADDSGKALLKGVQLNDPMRVNYMTNYEPIEKLGFEKITN